MVEFLFPSLIAVVSLLVQRAKWIGSTRIALTESIAAYVSSIFPSTLSTYSTVYSVTELFIYCLSVGILLTPFVCLVLSKKKPQEKDNGEKSEIVSSISSILQSIQSEEGDVLQYDGEWMTGDWLYFLGKVAGHVVDKQTTTDAPIAIMEEATPYAYSLFLGLAERGHSVVLISPSLSPSSIASILHEHHCELILLNQSLLDVLESVLEMDHAISLRAIFCTENHYFHPSEVGNSLRAEEALEQEFDLPVCSLDYAMDAFCSERGLAVEMRAPSLATAGLEVTQTPAKDATAMIVYSEEGERREVSHEELMEAVGRVLRTIPVETRDVVLMERELSVDTFAVFAACMERGCRLAVMTSVDDCHCMSPTVLAVSAETYCTLCEKVRSLSGLRRMMKRIHKDALFGGRLRWCLVFSSLTGVRPADIQSLYKYTHIETCIL